MDTENLNRRDFLKKASYITLAILTLPCTLSFASGGSGYQGDPRDVDEHGKHHKHAGEELDERDGAGAERG